MLTGSGATPRYSWDSGSRFAFELRSEDGKRRYASPLAPSEIRPIVPPDAYDIDLHTWKISVERGADDLGEAAFGPQKPQSTLVRKDKPALGQAHQDGVVGDEITELLAQEEIGLPC